MMRILKWAFDLDTPMWVRIVALMFGIAVTTALVALTVFLFAVGLWYLNAIIWIGIPAWILIEAYRKEQTNE
jgi:hypothetical protein